MTGSLRRLAALVCLAVLLAAAFVPGGGPLPAVLVDGPSLAGPAVATAAADAVQPTLRTGTPTLRSGRAPPTAA